MTAKFIDYPSAIMEKEKFSIVLGTAAIAAVVGFWVGASASPVAGVAITAGFGVLASALAYLFGQQTQVKAVDSPTQVAHVIPKGLGVLLLVIASSLIAGSAFGTYSRRQSAEPQTKDKFPWKRTPANQQEALDWIAAAERLRALGYSPAQIAEVLELKSPTDEQGSRKRLQFPDSLEILRAPIPTAPIVIESEGDPLTRRKRETEGKQPPPKSSKG